MIEEDLLKENIIQAQEFLKPEKEEV